MIKETETEETINFLSLVAFQFGVGGAGPGAPPGYAYDKHATKNPILKTSCNAPGLVANAMPDIVECFRRLFLLTLPTLPHSKSCSEKAFEFFSLLFRQLSTELLK